MCGVPVGQTMAATAIGPDKEDNMPLIQVKLVATTDGVKALARGGVAAS